MSHPHEYDNFVLHEIPRGAARVTILDVGSGLGLWGYLLKATRPDAVRVVGIDLAWPYLSFVWERRVYDLLVHGDVTRLPFRAKAFDYIVASEILEHLSKDQGWKLIHELSRCARRKVILTTPNGFKPQEVRGVPTETHRSGWSVRELRSAGFVVRGIGSRLKPLESEDVVLSSLFHFFGTPLAQAIPRLGEYLIAVQTLEKDGTPE